MNNRFKALFAIALPNNSPLGTTYWRTLRRSIQNEVAVLNCWAKLRVCVVKRGVRAKCGKASGVLQRVAILR